MGHVNVDNLGIEKEDKAPTKKGRSTHGGSIRYQQSWQLRMSSQSTTSKYQYKAKDTENEDSYPNEGIMHSCYMDAPYSIILGML